MNTAALTKVEQRADRIHIPMTRGLGLAEFGKKLAANVSRDHLTSFAATLAFRALFALFPFMIFMISMLGLTGGLSILEDGISKMETVLPGEAQALLTEQISRLADTREGAFTIGAVISVLVALWGMSGAFRAVMEALNVMYEVEDRRSFVRKLLTSVALSIGAALLFVAALVLAVAGGSIAEWLADTTGLGGVLEWTWKIAQWPILAAFVLLAFALTYYYAPDVEQDFRWISPGAILGFVMWMVFTLLFSLYVNNFSSYNETYGTIAGVAVLMLYLYYSALILLLGAEVNQIVEEHAPGGKDPGERETAG